MFIAPSCADGPTWGIFASLEVSVTDYLNDPRLEVGAVQANIPFHDLITPLTEPGQAMQPARLQGRVVTLRPPARTTPSSGVSLAMFGADLTVPGLIRSPGMVQSLALRSISDQLQPRTSPDRAAVRIRNSSASRPTVTRARNEVRNAGMSANGSAAK